MRRHRNLQRQLVNRAQIGRDVFAQLAIAPRRAQCEAAIFILQDHREAVELWFDNVAEAGLFILRQKAQQSLAPLAQVLFTEGVCQAQHRDLVPHFFETFGDCAADAYSWTVGVEQLRVLLFQRLEFAKEGVKGCVADLRIVKNVVAVLMVADALAQVIDPLLWSVHGRRIGRYAGLGRMGRRRRRLDNGGQDCILNSVGRFIVC